MDCSDVIDVIDVDLNFNLNVDGDGVVLNNLKSWKLGGICTCAGRSVSVFFLAVTVEAVLVITLKDCQ